MWHRVNDRANGVLQRRKPQHSIIQKKDKETGTPKRDSDPLENISCSMGDGTCAAKHVSVIQRKKLFDPMNEAQKISSMHRLQRQYGNSFAQRVIARNAIQTKLRIGKPGDIYEKEADRVAERVMSMPEPRVQRQQGNEEEPAAQTKPLAGQITHLIQRQDDEEVEKEEPVTEMELPEEDKEEIPLAQAKQVDGKTPRPSPGLEAQVRQVKGGGQPLPKSVRTFFEPRFGYDFSQVRVHTNAGADQITRAVRAKAFTKGRDIVFGAGYYAPETFRGQRLLAHELVHVVQQMSNGKCRSNGARSSNPAQASGRLANMIIPSWSPSPQATSDLYIHRKGSKGIIKGMSVFAPDGKLISITADLRVAQNAQIKVYGKYPNYTVWIYQYKRRGFLSKWLVGAIVRGTIAGAIAAALKRRGWSWLARQVASKTVAAGAAFLAAMLTAKKTITGETHKTKKFPDGKKVTYIIIW